MHLVAVVLAAASAVVIHNHKNHQGLIVDASGAMEHVRRGGAATNECKDRDEPPEGDDCIKWYKKYCGEKGWGSEDADDCGEYGDDFKPCELCSNVVGKSNPDFTECSEIFTDACTREEQMEQSSSEDEATEEESSDSDEETSDDEDDDGETLARSVKKKGKKKKKAEEDDEAEGEDDENDTLSDAKCEGKGKELPCSEKYGDFCDGYPCGSGGPLAWPGSQYKEDQEEQYGQSDPDGKEADE